MTDDKAFKQAVRDRMREHGEKYTVARRHTLAHHSSGGDDDGLTRAPIPHDMPTVIGRFVDAVIIKLPPGAGAATAWAAATFEAIPRSQTQECARLYALLDRAYRVWCANAVKVSGRDAMLEGLRSVGTVFDAGSAAYAGAMLGEYRLSIERDPRSAYVSEVRRHHADKTDQAARKVLLATQKAMRVAGQLPSDHSHEIPAGDRIRSVEWCATALVAAFDGAIVIDSPQEVADTARALETA